MKVGVILPCGADGGPDGHTNPRWTDVRAFAEAAERSGVDSVWLADHYGMHESWTLLSAVAAVTSRVELGTLVICSTFRDSGLLANMAATLDHVSRGRLILGVGAGCDEAEHVRFGLPTDHRVARFAEWLEIVTRLVRGETVSFAGTYHRVDGAVLEPPPDRHIPVVVAAERPRMLGLTAQWADAWATAWYGVPGNTVEAKLRSLAPALADAGRPDNAVARAVGVVVRDPEQPPVANPDPDVVAGTVAHLAAALTAYAALGVDHLIVLLEPINPHSLDRLARARQLAGV